MKITLIKYLLLSVLLLSIASCKKKDQEETNNSSQGTIVEPQNSNALFQISKNYFIQNDSTTFYGGSTFVVFYDSLKEGYYDPSIWIDAGSVSINNVYLKKTNGIVAPQEYFSYTDTLGKVFQGEKFWRVEGNSSFPATFLVDNTAYPKFSSIINLPDTISAEKTSTITVKNYIGADLIQISIDDVELERSKANTTHSNDFILTPELLSFFSHPINGYTESYVSIILIKSTYRKVGNKVFECDANLSVTKSIYFKE